MTAKVQHVSTITSHSRKLSSRGRRLGWVGVDLGTSALKIAQVCGEQGRWSLAAQVVVPAARSGTIGLSPAVASMLFDSTAFRGRRAACAIPLSAAELRTIELPVGSDTELREMIAQEIGATADFVNAQREFDFWELETPERSDGIRTYAVLSIAHDIAQQVAEDLLQAGMKCEAIDGVPFAIARAAAMNAAEGQPEVVAAIDWGFSSVTFVAAAAGEPIFVRSLRDCHLGLILKRMEDELGLTPSECYPLLVNYGLPHPNAGSSSSKLQEAIGDLVTDTLACLVDEVARTLSFAGRQLRRRSPKSLLLMGGGAAIRHSAEHVAARIQQPVDCWKLPTQSGAACPLQKHHTALFAVAAGLSQLGVQT